MPEEAPTAGAYPLPGVPAPYGSLGRREAVALHHPADSGQIRWPAGRRGEDVADLAEVGGPEDAGGRNREELRIDAAAVIKPVDLATRHAYRLPWTDLERLAVDCPRGDALEAVDRLLKGVVAVRRRHPRARGYIALEHRCGPVRVRGVNQETHAQRAYCDRLGAHGWTLTQNPQVRDTGCLLLRRPAHAGRPGDACSRCSIIRPTVPEEPTTPDLAERMKRSVEAFNAADFDLAVSFYAPDARLYPRAVGILEGREAIRSFFEDWHGMYEEFTFELEEFRDLGNGVTFSVVGQCGRLADTAAWIHDRFALVFTWVDGLIEKETNFTDADDGRAAAERLAEERGKNSDP